MKQTVIKGIIGTDANDLHQMANLGDGAELFLAGLVVRAAPFALLIVLCLALATTPACFVRRRAVTTVGARQTSPLLSATKDGRIQRLHGTSDPIQSFTALVMR